MIKLFLLLALSGSVDSILLGLRSQDPKVRLQSAKKAGELRDPKLIPALISLLDDRETAPQWQAVLSLASYGGQSARYLVEALEGENQDARWKAENALKMIGNPALPEIHRGLAHNSPLVRRSCAWLLGELRNNASIPFLIKALEDPDEDVRWKAGFSLKKLGSVAVPALAKVLHSGSLNARRVSAFILGEIRSKEPITALVKALRDTDADVRWKASRSLARLGSDVVEPLARIIKTDDVRAKRCAVWVLQQIPLPRCTTLLAQALHDTDAEVRWKAAVGLKERGESALLALAPALKSLNPEVRRVARWALQSIGTPSAQKLLSEVAPKKPTQKLSSLPIISTRVWNYTFLTPPGPIYNLYLRCEPAKGRARIILDWKDKKNYTLLEFSEHSIRIGECVSGVEQAQPLAPIPAEPPYSILIKRRSDHLSIFVDEKLLARYWKQAPRSSRVGLGGSSKDVKFGKPRFQKISGLHFADDFMRTSLTSGGWRILTGKWAVQSTLDARLSPNPFRCIGKGNPSALCTTGYEFWDDYEVSVDLKAQDEFPFGICFYFRDLASYYLLLLEPRNGRATLIQARNGKSSEIASAPVPIWLGHWYRLSVLCSGGIVRVKLNGRPLLEATVLSPSGGGIGLYTESHKGTLFDDVRLTSRRAFEITKTIDLPSDKPYPISTPLSPYFTLRLEPNFMTGQFNLRLGTHTIQISKDLLGPTTLSIKDGATIRQTLERGLPLEGLQLTINFSDGYSRINLDSSQVETYPGTTASICLPPHSASSLHRLRYEELPPPKPLPLESEKFKMHSQMDNWAKQAGIWKTQRFNGSLLYWHKGTFYGDVSLGVQFSHGISGSAEAHLFLARDFSTTTAYHLLLKPDQIALYQGETLLTKKPLKIKNPSYIVLRKAGRFLIGFAEATTLLRFDLHKLKTPYTGGMRLGFYGKNTNPLLDRIEILSPNSFDYLFEQAPVDWYPLAGNWKVTNRWLCSPQWSWLGGVSNTLALLWHRYPLYGDTIFEYFVAMKMNSSRPPYYLNVSDFNLVLCGDGQNLDSGYNFIFGGWNNTRTAILKRGKLLLQTNRFLLPKNYHTTAHRHWFHIRAEKTHNPDGSATLRFLIDGKKVLEYLDRQPLPGGHCAIWTYNGGIMIARARIYAQKVAQPLLLPTIPPTRLIPRKPTFPLKNDFESDTGDWKPIGDVSLTLSSPGFHSSRALKVLNRRPGGDFAFQALASTFDTATYPKLSFNYRIDTHSRLNLYLQIPGHKQLYEILLTAPQSSSHKTLAAFPLKADLNWHTLTVPLYQLLKSAHLPTTLSRILFANYSDSDYLQAGIGGNPLRSTLLLDNFTIH